jgi:7-carboxy-7-deazaguanine synthase
MLEVVERFVSISGEAPIIGHPTYFYRFSKCNLNCRYCDTEYKDEVNFKLTENEVIYDIKETVTNYSSLKVLFTGGEPLLGDRQDKLLYIIRELPEVEFYIETNGAIEIKPNNLSNCHFVCDYKSPASGEADSFKNDNLKILNGKRDCLKFVLANDDLEWFLDKVHEINRINSDLPIYASPVYNDLKLETLTTFILDNKLPVNISIQLHKIVWPDIDRGV